MRDGRLAQRILSLVVRGDRAAAMVGDLVEEATARGPLWFWTAIARTTLAFFWLSVSTAVRRLTNPSSTLLDTGVQMTAATTQTRSVFATLWRFGNRVQYGIDLLRTEDRQGSKPV